MGNVYKIGNKLVLGHEDTSATLTYAFYFYDGEIADIRDIAGEYIVQGVVLDDIVNNSAVKPPKEFRIGSFADEGLFRLDQDSSGHYYLYNIAGTSRSSTSAKVLFGKYSNYFVDSNGELYPSAYLFRQN